MMRYIAWIKGRFDVLNDNPRESEKMEKGMEITGLLMIREFIRLSANSLNGRDITTNDISRYIDGGLGSSFDSARPNDILREHLEKYQAQQDALEQARQAALADNQGNDNDQVADNSSLMDHPNANDDL